MYLSLGYWNTYKKIMSSCHIINMKLLSHFQKEFHQIITYQELSVFYWVSMYKNVVDQLGLLLSTWSFSSSHLTFQKNK